MANASLSFLPWVRQGAAAAISTADSRTPTQAAVATVAAAVTLNGAAVPGVAVKLRGPADVIGIDTNQIVRTDPRPATNDFEPNCFPSIEFGNSHGQSGRSAIAPPLTGSSHPLMKPELEPAQSSRPVGLGGREEVAQ